MGKVRQIDNPSKALKAVQSKILDRLLKPVELPHFLFGAVAKRCVAKHAFEHLDRGPIVKLDIKSYYPNVTARHVYGVWRNVLNCSSAVSSLLTKLTTYDWHLPQGAPTSPALANLFLASIYAPVIEACSAKGVVATAWVDDLIFSGRDARSVIKVVRKTLAANGLKLPGRKRHILPGDDAKIITGVRLGAGRIRAPREKVRDTRAAIHKIQTGRIVTSDLDGYLESLKGKIGHVDRLCAADAKPLNRQLAKAIDSNC